MQVFATAAVVLMAGTAVALAASATARRRLRQALCSHETHLKNDALAGLVWERCVKCGYDTPGWVVDVDARFPITKALSVTKVPRRPASARDASADAANVKRFRHR